MAFHLLYAWWIVEEVRAPPMISILLDIAEDDRLRRERVLRIYGGQLALVVVSLLLARMFAVRPRPLEHIADDESTGTTVAVGRYVHRSRRHELVRTVNGQP